MSIAQLSTLGFQVSLVAIVLAAGMATSARHAFSLARKPGLLLRSLVSMQVLAPLLAVALATTLPLNGAVKIALVMVAVSPVPPFIPRRELKAGGSRAYAISLLATSAMLSVLIIPVTLLLLGRWFGLPLAIAPLVVAKLVAMTVLIPLAVGICVHELAPAFGTRASRFVDIAGSLLLVASMIPKLISAWPSFLHLIGDGTLVILVTFVVGALLIGHLLGGPRSENRTVLALSTASRHPGIAIALAQANFAEQRLAVPAVLLFVIVSVVVSTPYVTLSRRYGSTPQEDALRARHAASR
jgi:BASS family bile acid:Na+ symporter